MLSRTELERLGLFPAQPNIFPYQTPILIGLPRTFDEIIENAIAAGRIRVVVGGKMEWVMTPIDRGNISRVEPGNLPDILRRNGYWQHVTSIRWSPEQKNFITMVTDYFSRQNPQYISRYGIVNAGQIHLYVTR
ncbi:hypothetical protein [Yersinia bercovieri]|uniref:hypothetical protein n=1 Tax=Yersinia bercovieri TaxID=634 RepID=UPI00119FC434|nr:hypothetical protein [Yersinia bercovieri]